MIPPQEHRHLIDGPSPGEQPGGAGTVTVRVHGGEGAEQVLRRCKEVMLTIVGRQTGRWPSVDEWRLLLPGWFVTACGSQSDEDAEAWLAEWRSLPPQQRAAAEALRPWDLADWLHWLQPDERAWFWWDAVVESEDSLMIELEVDGHPVPLGSLIWLSRAAGAAAVDVAEVGA